MDTWEQIDYERAREWAQLCFKQMWDVEQEARRMWAIVERVMGEERDAQRAEKRAKKQAFDEMMWHYEDKPKLF